MKIILYLPDKDNQMNNFDILDTFFPRLAEFNEDSFPDKKFPLIVEKDNSLTIKEDKIGKEYVVQKIEKNYEIKYLIKDVKIVKDMGIFYSNYAEFILNPDLEISEKHFTIGDLEVDINNQPTLLFNAAHYDLTYDKDYREAISNHFIFTLSLKGESLNQENLEENLSKALFILGYYGNEFYKFYPSFFEYKDFYYEDSILKDTTPIDSRQQRNLEYNLGHFGDINHPTAIRFYNEGMQIKDKEISFQYFYKVLEHFWVIARKEKFKVLISNDPDNKNIDDLFNNVQNVFSNDEGTQLRILLESIETDITQLVKSASENKLSKKNSVKEFSRSLYSYRNSVVHAKDETNLTLKLPNIWENEKEKFWIEATRQISEILIEKYCLNIQ
jgi:hypothetical protein